MKQVRKTNFTRLLSKARVIRALFKARMLAVVRYPKGADEYTLCRAQFEVLVEHYPEIAEILAEHDVVERMP